MRLSKFSRTALTGLTLGFLSACAHQTTSVIESSSNDFIVKKLERVWVGEKGYPFKSGINHSTNEFFLDAHSADLNLSDCLGTYNFISKSNKGNWTFSCANNVQAAGQFEANPHSQTYYFNGKTNSNKALVFNFKGKPPLDYWERQKIEEEEKNKYKPTAPLVRFMTLRWTRAASDIHSRSLVDLNKKTISTYVKQFGAETCKGGYELNGTGTGTWQLTCSSNISATGKLVKQASSNTYEAIGKDNEENDFGFTIHFRKEDSDRI